MVRPPSLPDRPGRLVDVGGHRLHLLTAGSGSPTVVLEAGGAGWSLDWVPVLQAVAPVTGVCAYDRAGLGWSDPGPQPRTAERLASELHTLVHRAGLPPPYLLVGASFGGHVVRLLAHHHPEQVAGMVLLDARHEDLDAAMPRAWAVLGSTGIAVYRVALLASRAGLLRAAGAVGGARFAPSVVHSLPPEYAAVYLDVAYRPTCLHTNLQEAAAIRTSDAQVRAAGDLAELPLTVVRHGVPSMFRGLPPPTASTAERVWQELQDDLATRSGAGRVVVAGRSGHAIQVDEPDVVVAAVEEMVDRTRRAA